MKLKTLLWVCAISFVIFVAVNIISARPKEPMPEAAMAGKLVWQKHNCVSCHTLFGNGGYDAEDLTHIITKKTPDELVNYLVSPPVMRPNKYKHHPGLSEKEADDLVQYFKYVNDIPTLGWPPQPESTGSGS